MAAALALTFFAALCVAAYVLARGPDNPINRHYAIAMLAFGVWTGCIILESVFRHPGIGPMRWFYLGTASTAMAVSAIVYVSYLLPDPTRAGGHQAALSYLVGGLVATLCLMGSLWNVESTAADDYLYRFEYRPAFALFAAWVMGGPAYAIFALKRRLLEIGEPETRLEIKVVMAATGSAAVLASIGAVILPVGFGRLDLLPWTPPVVVLGVGLAAAYAVRRLGMAKLGQALERIRLISVTRKIILSGVVMSAIVMGVLLPFTGRLVGIEGGAMWLKYSLYTLLAVILIELPTLLYMIRIVSKPLGELTEAAWSLSRGNVARRVNISSDDEMGVLASAFNIMAANLERDINELRRLNQAIAEEKNLSRNVFDSIEISIVVLDTEGRVLEWNRAQEHWTGTKRADALGRLIVSELLPHVREKIVDSEMFREVVDTGRPVRRYNVPLPERDGPPRRIVNVTLVPLIDQDGARYGSVVILEDVTELKALERDLVRQAKLASVGVLASGIVHEVNNPLASISSLLQFLRDEEADEERRATFKTMIDQVQRVATTLQGVVDFARQRPAEKREMDVGALVASTVKFISFDKRFKHVKIHESYAPALPKVLGDWDQVQQVVMNLMFNAADAMPEGGDLYVSAGASEAGGVWFEVRDTGHGIPDDVLDKIFDPFFTTKPTGKGTGLGLSVCDGIIQSHGGAIAVRTARGAGATFRVTLPAAPAAAREEETA